MRSRVFAAFLLSTGLVSGVTVEVVQVYQPLSLHGTDGIRGKVSASPKTDLEALEAIIDRREVNGRAFMIIGEAIGKILADLIIRDVFNKSCKLILKF